MDGLIYTKQLLNILCIEYNTSWAFQWPHRFVYTPLDYFVNLVLIGQINTLLIENLAFVAVL